LLGSARDSSTGGGTRGLQPHPPLTPPPPPPPPGAAGGGPRGGGLSFLPSGRCARASNSPPLVTLDICPNGITPGQGATRQLVRGHTRDDGGRGWRSLRPLLRITNAIPRLCFDLPSKLRGLDLQIAVHDRRRQLRGAHRGARERGPGGEPARGTVPPEELVAGRLSLSEAARRESRSGREDSRPPCREEGRRVAVCREQAARPGQRTFAARRRFT